MPYHESHTRKCERRMTAAMMDGMEDSQDLLAEDQGKDRTESNVDLNTDTSLQVDISDALSERDKVKFTVHTKTTLPEFSESEFSVQREHEEFIWLHTMYEENEDYGGIIIPPAPPRPDFDASREKLQKLGEGEGTMTKEEFNKMKQELEAEYLATFKKTVAMHEVFLQRLAAHAILRNDHNFRVFLEYKQDLNVRGKNKKERLSGLMKFVTKSVDEVLVSGQKDVDSFFEHEKNFLVEYHNKVKDATMKSDKMTRSHKDVADTYIKISGGLLGLGTIDKTELDKFFIKIAETFEKLRKLEARVASDEDLKQSDLLRYYMRDSSAAKDLLYRRMRALVNYQNANKALEKARMKNKDVHAAERNQTEACEKFEKMSDVAKGELTDFKARRVVAYRKNLTELAELELKHAKAQVQLLRNTLASLKEDMP
ncbi:sorting nexin-6 isoform X4 [Strongylocentrotus purpuratus]|uniref:Sorting nexin n=1 Tax=Strongylocentrotus purpuratus TaxID=7668 RepID=A0A7M7RGE0_STRPU|nr:sorting nexin-6 isoform X4 [Strongylocentrotus purpuratus]|eukprot:XP_791140.3 PREDICTED: sorting nexin-6 isoform X2 [Strongylocentrotus purpuratus]